MVLKTVLSLVLIGLVHGRLRRRGMGGFGCAFLLVLMSIPFRMGLGTIRPQIFTYLFFYGELVLLDKASSGRDRWLWVLPLMLAVWMNLHGGVLAGAGVLGIWIVVRLIAHPLDHSRSVERRLHAGLNLGLIAVASGGALLINPYGAELVAFLLRTATVARPEIREWVPLALVSLPGQLYLGLLLIGGAGMVGSRRPRPPEAVVILIVTAALPLVSSRHYPLFALALVVLAGEHIADVWTRWSWPAWARVAQSPRSPPSASSSHSF